MNILRFGQMSKKFGVLFMALSLVALVSGCASKKSGGESSSTSSIADGKGGEYGTGATEDGGIGLGTLERVHFGFDASSLTNEARDTLSNNAKIMMNNPDMKVMVEGHCDERGSNEYNIALGERRAKAVINYLVNLGVQRARLEMKSWGEERPLDPSKGARAYSLNRRAEFVILEK